MYEVPLKRFSKGWAEMIWWGHILAPHPSTKSPSWDIIRGAMHRKLPPKSCLIFASLLIIFQWNRRQWLKKMLSDPHIKGGLPLGWNFLGWKVNYPSYVDRWHKDCPDNALWFFDAYYNRCSSENLEHIPLGSWVFCVKDGEEVADCSSNGLIAPRLLLVASGRSPPIFGEFNTPYPNYQYPLSSLHSK